MPAEPFFKVMIGAAAGHLTMGRNLGLKMMAFRAITDQSQFKFMDSS